MKSIHAVVSACVAVAAAPASGFAYAAPFCFETGPGYQKCVNSGHDLTPVYEGPKIYDGGNVPWVPSYNPTPVYAAPPVLPTSPAPNLDALAGALMKDVQDGLDAKPENAQVHIQVLRMSVMRTGNATFEAMATMAAAGHAPHDIPVHVFTTDSGPNWKIDPGAMAPLFE